LGKIALSVLQQQLNRYKNCNIANADDALTHGLIFMPTASAIAIQILNIRRAERSQRI